MTFRATPGFRLFAMHITIVSALNVAVVCPAENPFFAMDTGVSGTPAEVAGVLEELGYAGLGGSPTGADEMAAALQQHDLTLFNVYWVLKFDDQTPALSDSLRDCIDSLRGYESALWIAVSEVRKEGQPVALSSTDGDDVAVSRLREIADYAAARDVSVSLYPHTNYWMQRFEDSIRLAEKLDRSDVGITFNLCHWLKVEGDRDPSELLTRSMPRLSFVTLNGADRGDTRSMGWARLIQPLGSGSYDGGRLVETLHAMNYKGPVGLQAYGIKGDQRENLRRSMDAWKAMQPKNE
ncbi:sugar phosphate isomerase/epimerase family protein [Novipirellula rosea]